MKTIVSTIACAAALAAFAPAYGQDEDVEDAETETVEQEEGAEDAAAKSEKLFHTLPRVREFAGTAEVLAPLSKEWVAVERGAFHPLGSAYRTVGSASRLTVEFGVGCSVSLEGDASFSTRAQPLGLQTRTIVLSGGVLNVKLPRNLPVGAFSVAAPNLVAAPAVGNVPGFTVDNPAGEARYTYERGVDGDNATIKCVTGVLSVKGRHYAIPEMHAADEVRIRTAQDGLFTGLYGLAGDYTVNLDQGLIQTVDFETQERKIEQKTLAWKLSPLTAAHIHRIVPAIGEKLSVTVMTFDAAGMLKNRCAFAEGRPEINSGEHGPTSRKEKEAIAKKAAAATEGAAAEGEGASAE